MPRSCFQDQALDHPDLHAARLLTEEELGQEIADLKSRIAWLRERDSIFGGHCRQRMRANDNLARRVIIREERSRVRLAAEAEARRNATARVKLEYEWNGSRDQQCVFVTCNRSQYEAGPIWGWGEKSVLRALTTLSKECSCGAEWHRREETQYQAPPPRKEVATGPYLALGVERDADVATIKKAFRKAALDSHPDQNPDDPKAEARFKEVARAWAVLGDEDRRLGYDMAGLNGYPGYW